MKILLCYPPVSEEYNPIRDSGLAPHLSTLCIASHLESLHDDLDFLLLDGHHLSLEEICGKIRTFSPDILGCSVDFTNYNNAVRLCEYSRKISPEIWNVLGSNHATNMADRILRNRRCIDFVSTFDGEPSWEDLVLIRKGKLPREKGRNLAWYDPDTRRVIHTRKELMDLEEMRGVDYPLIDMEPYFAMQEKVLGKGFRMMQFTSQRGCANKPLCVFCGRYTDGIRFRDPEVYAKEIAYWTEKYDLTEVWDRSDSFIQSRRWLMDFCHAMEKHTHRFREGRTTFKTYARADQLLKEDVIDCLKGLNFRMVFIGYEAGDDRILKNIGKHSNLEVYLKATENVFSAGLDIDASFIVGLPGENRQSMDNHVAFARQLVEMGLDKIRVNRLLVLPGTPLYRKVMETFPELNDRDIIPQDLLQHKLFLTDLYDLNEFGGDVEAFKEAQRACADAMTGTVLAHGGGAEGYGYGKGRNILRGKQLQSRNRED